MRKDLEKEKGYNRLGRREEHGEKIEKNIIDFTIFPDGRAVQGPTWKEHRDDIFHGSIQAFNTRSEFRRGSYGRPSP